MAIRREIQRRNAGRGLHVLGVSVVSAFAPSRWLDSQAPARRAAPKQPACRLFRFEPHQTNRAMRCRLAEFIAIHATEFREQGSACGRATPRLWISQARLRIRRRAFWRRESRGGIRRRILGDPCVGARPGAYNALNERDEPSRPNKEQAIETEITREPADSPPPGSGISSVCPCLRPPKCGNRDNAQADGKRSVSQPRPTVCRAITAQLAGGTLSWHKEVYPEPAISKLRKFQGDIHA
ncbi:hypothetical protein FHX49_000009 [Microbacterium endophyticum]|uniref:Uncharacterized protein n=1 Tax=Microbacterium endophyticum TaxID=1526412 RepID=A0A7W4YKU3_9MICO|nr:hypothetical protein [Microbacterium endophyticum]NIK36765.1 hypothetical protein [Microbacterium endophyticum]